MASGTEPSQRVRIAVNDGVADVRLDRPEKMNALDPAMIAGLIAAGERLGRETGLRCVVLSGEGRAFCAGLDVASFAAAASGEGASLVPGDLAERTFGRANHFQHVALLWRSLPVPVIAAVHGVAYGGGFQIALGADMRVVAPDARMSVMEIKWGLVPDMGGVLLMRELARADAVRELTYTGRVFTGEEALALGFATRVAPDPREVALGVAREIAGRSPHAVRAAKRLFNTADEELEAAILLAESAEQKALIGSANQREASLASLAGRTPIFRDPDVGTGAR